MSKMDKGELQVIIPLHEKDMKKLPSCLDSLLKNLYFIQADNNGGGNT